MKPTRHSNSSLQLSHLVLPRTVGQEIVVNMRGALFLLVYVLCLFPGLNDCSSAPLKHSNNCDRFVMGGAYWGLNNQMASIMRSVVTASKLDACVVLPAVLVDYDNPFFSWDVILFREMFNLSHFVQHCMRKNVRVIPFSRVPTELQLSCIAQLQHDKQNSDASSLSLSDLKQHLKRLGILCFSSFATISLQTAQDHDIVSWWDALQPSARFRQAADRIFSEIRRRHGPNITTLHARTEADFEHACSVGFHGEKQLFQKQCLLSDDGIANFLLQNMSITKGSSLYVSSGNPRASFPSLCGTFNCLFKDDFDLEKYAGFLVTPKKVTFHGYLDYLVASKGQMFIGNVYSSFSRTLSWTFQVTGRQSFFYNPPVH
mmetsp:Transcript_28531/g.84485  ORF Transcript_28531/g.84485 Transcript_28531/m.84485 type:complete len:373 (-) Transcript_28531:1314-2432(-)|eukprot:360726-Chlamydomonas_euryale.AAC.2